MRKRVGLFLERFAVLNEIDKFDLIELIKFLGNREFIIFGDTVETR